MYIARYLLDGDKADFLSRLQSKKVQHSQEGIQQYKFGNFSSGNQNGGFVAGKLAVRREQEDFVFEDQSGDEIKTRPSPIYVYDEILFTIFPDIKVIVFSSKSRAKIFGMELLSKQLFGQGGKVFGLTFYPQRVLDAKKEGKFENVWYNGIKYQGKMTYVGQFGTEIDEDAQFIDTPARRDGLGVQFSSRLGKQVKVAVYADGTLHSPIKIYDSYDRTNFYKELVLLFLPYSNYGDQSIQTRVEKMPSLTDYFE